MEKVLQRSKKIKAEVTQKANAVNSKLKRREAAARELKQERLAKEETLSSLQAQALRLETVVTSLMNEGSERPSQRSAPESKVEDSHQDRERFEGPGLQKLQVKLVKPIAGKVQRKYGKYKPSEFDDFVLQKGIDFKAAAGAEVRAIGPGKVIHVGRLPGYGTVTILDHGQRSYSLYGRLAQVRVKSGAIVGAGETLATVGELDPKGRNFYFETRINGAPVDPQRFYKVNLGSGR